MSSTTESILETAVPGSRPHSAFDTVFRLLTFRLTHEEFGGMTGRFMLIGLAGTWLAGVGRTWSNPDASVPEHLGVGSLLYVLVLTAFLWLIFAPLARPACRFGQVFTFVTLTSFPALLYAVPVEWFFARDVAESLRLAVLVLLSAWRVALLVYFLRVLLRFSWFRTSVATLLPLAAMTAVLVFLHQMDNALRHMGSFRAPPADATERVVDLLGLVACWSFPLLGVVYLVLVFITQARVE